MSLPDRTTVLIVGAGPAGLAAAHTLLHHGFHDFIIVDAVPQGENTSRAIVVHAATLEVSPTVLVFYVSKSCKGIRRDRLRGRHHIARNEKHWGYHQNPFNNAY